MRRLTIIILALALVPLAGCVGGDDDGGAGDQDLTKAQAAAGPDAGAIDGVVTDSAVQPIEGANVTVVELDVTVQTNSGGGFEIGSVPPGTHTVVVRAPGYVSASQEVQVEKASLAEVDFVLTRLNIEEPFKQQFEVTGFFEYGWGLGQNLTGDAQAVRDNNCDYDPIAGPNCRGEMELEPPLDSIIFEMEWEPGTPLAQEMMALMRVSDNASIITGEWQFFRVEGPSPLYHRMDREDLDAVAANFTERCQNGEDQFCGLNFRDKGWPMQTRVWPGWRCPTGQAGFCAVVQQTYTQYISAFYHQAAPQGYSIIDG